MKIIFVYAFSPNDPQIQSPYSITKNLYHYLSERADVEYHQWDSIKQLEDNSDAILLGHPHYDTRTIVQQAFRKNKRFLAKCLIHPFHHGRVGDNMPFDDLARKADKIFSICGPYWYDTIANTPFAHWGPKITRLDMAVDCNHFPYLKTKFNDPPNRKLVYIGSSMPQKNLRFMVELMHKMPDVQLHWYGGSGDHALAKLPNVKTVGWITLNRAAAQKIVNECDIFINTSISDANPTTLLEARAWGLITACTKESGYYNDPFFTELQLGDLQSTIDTIRKLLNTDSDILLKRSIESRHEIESKYNWERFCKTVWDELQCLYTQKK